MKQINYNIYSTRCVPYELCAVKSQIQNNFIKIKRKLLFKSILMNS